MNNEDIISENIEDFVFRKMKKPIKKKISKKFQKKGKSPGQSPGKWVAPKKEPNNDEKRKLLGLAIEIMLKICLENHVYQFNGQKRLQGYGCATRLTLTGDVGDLYMMWWDGQLKSKLECLSIQLDIFARFKDDVNILGVGDPLKPGSTFV